MNGVCINFLNFMEISTDKNKDFYEKLIENKSYMQNINKKLEIYENYYCNYIPTFYKKPAILPFLFNQNKYQINKNELIILFEMSINIHITNFLEN